MRRKQAQFIISLNRNVEILVEKSEGSVGLGTVRSIWQDDTLMCVIPVVRVTN